MALAIGFSPFFSSGINRLLYQDDINLSKNRESSANILEESCLDERVNNIRLSVPEILNGVTSGVTGRPSILVVPQLTRNGVVLNQLPNTRTNFIQNNTMVGATGSVRPNLWDIGSLPSGFTVSYSASGQTTAADGTLVDYIDVTVSGTALASGFLNLRQLPSPSPVSGNLLFASGMTYTASVYLALLSGSLTGVATNAMALQEIANTTFIDQTTFAPVTGITSALTRFSGTRPIEATGGADRTSVRWGHSIVSGTSYDYTVRIASPQLEKGSVATPLIRTASGFVTVQDMVQGAQDVNLAWHSQTWASGTNWQIGQITTVTGTSGTLDPLGTNTANSISPTAVNDRHFLTSNFTTSVSYTSGTIYTQTAFFKQGTGSAGRYVQLSFANNRFTQLGYANFDLQTGALVASGGTADANRAASIENYGNGWYRCRLTATCNSTGTSNGLQVFLITASGDTRLPFFTGVTGDILYGWGAQVEVGSTATPYISTTTSARARAAYDGAPPDFTFTRDTTATRVNASGLIESVASGVLRLDYPVTGGCPAALIEPSAQNLAWHSETWASGTNWNLNNNVTTATGTTGTLDPLGTNTANAISPTAVSGNHFLQSNSPTTITFTSGTIYTQSAFFKQGTGDAGRYVQLTFTSSRFSQGGYANFDLQTGAVVASGGTADTNRAASIESYGNGWYRCRFTATCNSDGTGVGVIPVLIRASGDTRAPSFAGVTGDVFYGWGAQLEKGAIPTSYIPTTTGSATRAADVCSVSAVSGYIGQTQGTLYAEVDIQTLTNTGVFLSISDGTTNNRIQIYKFTNGQIYADRISATQSALTSITTNVLSAGIYKIAFAYQSGDSALFINGIQIGSNATQTFTFGTIDKINIGARLDNTQIFNDRIRAAAIYKTRLPNDVLAVMTNPEKTTWAQFVTRSSTYTELPACLETRDNQIIIV